MGVIRFSLEDMVDEKRKYTNEEEKIVRNNEVIRKGRINSTYMQVKNEIDHFLIKYYPFSTVLDLGCGSGDFLLSNSDNFSLFNRFNYVGVDFSKEAINKNILNTKSSRVKFVCSDILEFLKLQKDNSFDLITMFGVMGHIIDKEEVVKIYNQIGRIASRVVCTSNFYGAKFDEYFFKSSYCESKLYACDKPINSLIEDFGNMENVEIYDVIKGKRYVTIIGVRE